MEFLLDTNVLLFAASEPHRLSRSAMQVIVNPDHRRFVSAVAVWECATKVQRGKLSLSSSIPDWMELQSVELQLSVLPVELSHCYTYARLPVRAEHKDPFDRMLVAQAISERMSIVSSDRLLAGYGVDVIW